MCPSIRRQDFTGIFHVLIPVSFSFFLRLFWGMWIDAYLGSMIHNFLREEVKDIFILSNVTLEGF